MTSDDLFDAILQFKAATELSTGRIETKVDRLDQRMGRIETRVGHIGTDVSEIKHRLIRV